MVHYVGHLRRCLVDLVYLCIVIKYWRTDEKVFHNSSSKHWRTDEKVLSWPVPCIHCHCGYMTRGLWPRQMLHTMHFHSMFFSKAMHVILTTHWALAHTLLCFFFFLPLGIIRVSPDSWVSTFRVFLTSTGLALGVQLLVTTWVLCI